ncbi:hypothetical protein IWX49DRAFT_551741 [Phyllosticta citricarpa]|uniref:Uncharacterized protein n=2 Tax=Phyllosticta TaxID=121621 RepID=A0ABR1M8P8_9PEZI
MASQLNYSSPSAQLNGSNIDSILVNWESQADAIMAAEAALDKHKGPMKRFRAFLQRNNPKQAIKSLTSKFLLVSRGSAATDMADRQASSVIARPVPRRPRTPFPRAAAASPDSSSPASSSTASSIPTEFFSLPDAAGIPNFFGSSDSPPKTSGPSGPVLVNNSNQVVSGLSMIPTSKPIRRKPVNPSQSLPDPSTVLPTLVPAFGRAPGWDVSPPPMLPPVGRTNNFVYPVSPVRAQWQKLTSKKSCQNISSAQA